MDFKNLTLDKELFMDRIESFLKSKEINYTIDKSIKKKNNNQFRIEMKIEEKDFFLDYWVSKQNNITLGASGGHRELVDLKRELCEFISNECKKEKNNVKPWFVCKKIKSEDAQTVIDFIQNYSNNKGIVSNQAPQNGCIYKFVGDDHIELTVTHYTNNTLMIQGKIGNLFSYALEVITNLFKPDEISKNLSESGFFTCKIEDSVVESRLKDIMPNSFDKLPNDTVKRNIMQAIIFSYYDANFYDYTVYTFNAFRALEAHLRFILAEFGIDDSSTCDQNGKKRPKMFYMFDKENQTYKLQNIYISNIESVYPLLVTKIVEYINEIYYILAEERNKYFHWEKFSKDMPIDETAHIEDQTVARNKVISYLTMIDKYYTII